MLGLNCNLVIASNLLLGEISAYLNKNNKNILDTKLTKEVFENLVNKLDKKEITNQIAKEILPDLMDKDIDLDKIVEEKNKNSLSEDDLKNLINNIVDNNPASIKDFKEGKDRAVKYLMGQVMKETKGSANPGLANKLLVEILKEK